MFFRQFLKLFLIFNIIFFISFIIRGCDTGTDSNTIEFPSENISYYQHVSPFFDEQCYCHRTNGSAINVMNISTPLNIEDLYWGRFIKPGDALGSDLYLAMKYPDRPGNLVQMPYGLSPVNSNQQNGIRVWINEGAKVDQ